MSKDKPNIKHNIREATSSPSRINSLFHFASHRGPDSSSDPYSKRTRLPRCGDVGYIAKLKYIRISGLASLSILIILLTLAAYPIVMKDSLAEATAGIPSTTTLTMDTLATSASLDLTVRDSAGTFASSSASEMAKFNVLTNNYTGYTLTISSSTDTGILTNTDTTITTNNTLSSISSVVDNSTFSSSTALNGKWGYLPSKYNSATNVAFLPAPTTVASTLDTTTVANTTANNYTIGLGARVDYTKPAGTYTNTFILSAVGNPVPYAVYYNDNSGDSSVSNLPSVTSGTSKLTNVTLSSTIPTRTGYTFKSWCSSATTDSGTVCPSGSTEYAPSSSFSFIDQTASSNVANLYAVWTANTYSLSISFINNKNTSISGISSVKVCKVAGDCSGDNLVGTISTSGDSIASLPYNSTYYLYPVISSGYELDKWTKEDIYGTISSTSDTNPTYTIGLGNGNVTVAVNTTYTIQEFTDSMCGSMASSAAFPVTDVRDGQVYYVRYINGNCWMVDNLRLGYDPTNASSTAGISSMVLTPDTSNVITTRALTNYDFVEYGPVGGKCDSTNGFNNGCIHSGIIAAESTYAGVATPTVWYNYLTVTAGTIAGDSNTTTDTENICPKGWTLPSKAQTDSIGGGASASSVYVSDFSTVWGGGYRNDVLYNESVHGIWWGGEAYSSIERRNLRFNGSGLYTGSILRSYGYYVRCVRDTRTIGSISTMQEMTPTIAANTANGATATLTDARDSQTYTVAKINGNVWMTQNLRLGYNASNPNTTTISLTPSDSNVSTNRTITTYDLVTYGSNTSGSNQCYGTYDSATGTGSGAGYVNGCIHSGSNNYSGGNTVWYNYAAATMGTITGTSNTTTATESMCPKGWTLPAKNQIDSITAEGSPSGSTSYITDFSPALGGFYRHGALNSMSTLGLWWASEARNNMNRYYLFYDASRLYTGNDIRYYGHNFNAFYIRCVQTE